MVYFYGKYRPDSVKIFGSSFKVEWFATIDTVGEVDFEKSTIRICKGASPGIAVDTLIHEILHVIWYFTSLGKSCKEERCVSVLASGLNSVLSSNPDLGKWFNEVHDEE